MVMESCVCVRGVRGWGTRNKKGEKDHELRAFHTFSGVQGRGWGLGTRDPFTDFSASVISEPGATRCPELLSVDSSEHSMVLYCIPSLISMTHVWAPLTFPHNEKFHRAKQFSSQKIKSNTHPLLSIPHKHNLLPGSPRQVKKVARRRRLADRPNVASTWTGRGDLDRHFPAGSAMSTRGKCTLSSCRVTLFSVISKSTPNKPSVVSFFSLSHVYETGADKHTNARMNFNYLKWFQSIKKIILFLKLLLSLPSKHSRSPCPSPRF